MKAMWKVIDWNRVYIGYGACGLVEFRLSGPRSLASIYFFIIAKKK